MVDLNFKARAQHFIPLALVKSIASGANEPPDLASYIGEDGVKAIKAMHLIVRPRLSVQPVTKEAWDTINLLASKAGWDEESAVPGSSSNKKRKAEAPRAKGGRRKSKRNKGDAGDTGEDDERSEGEAKKPTTGARRGRPRRSKKTETDDEERDDSDAEEERDADDGESHSGNPEHGILKNAEEGGGNVDGVVVYGAQDEDPEAVEKRNEKVDVQEDVKVIEPKMKRAVRTRPRK